MFFVERKKSPIFHAHLKGFRIAKTMLRRNKFGDLPLYFETTEKTQIIKIAWFCIKTEVQTNSIEEETH